jgi:Gram-negative bacterial TonB protein C-terminal
MNTLSASGRAFSFLLICVNHFRFACAPLSIEVLTWFLPGKDFRSMAGVNSYSKGWCRRKGPDTMLREGTHDRKELQTRTASEDPVSRPCAAKDPLGTFARGIVVEHSVHSVRHSWFCAVSLLIHAALIGLLAILPFYFVRELQPYSLTRSATVTPVPLFLPVEQEHPPRIVRTMFQPVLSNPALVGPVVHLEEPSPATALSAPQIDPVLPAGANPVGNLFGEILGTTPPLAVPGPPSYNPTIFIGGDVRASRLLCRVSLAYPAVARFMHIAGRVILQAIIDTQGNVRRVRAVSGPPVLAAEAARAVAREKFAPTLLDGHPTESALIVEVTFRLRYEDPDAWP